MADRRLYHLHRHFRIFSASLPDHGKHLCNQNIILCPDDPLRSSHFDRNANFTQKNNLCGLALSLSFPLHRARHFLLFVVARRFRRNTHGWIFDVFVVLPSLLARFSPLYLHSQPIQKADERGLIPGLSVLNPQTRKDKPMKRALQSAICLMTILTVCLLGGSTVFSLSPENDIFLAETPDAGLAYQDSLLFLGESTTSHLASREVLSGGKNTAQILTAKNQTMRLSPKITTQIIIDPKTHEESTVADTVARIQPAYLVLSFGLNGIVGFAKNPESYLNNYQKLIDVLQKSSPKTAIILQTVYPVTTPIDGSSWNFSASPEEVNDMINTVNNLLPTLATANTGVKIADTASVLKDEKGALRTEFCVGDGIHLTAEAYREILSYLRTHAYHIPTPLPITPDQWRDKQ